MRKVTTRRIMGQVHQGRFDSDSITPEATKSTGSEDAARSGIPIKNENRTKTAARIMRRLVMMCTFLLYREGDE
jgi:hypothetical protein